MVHKGRAYQGMSKKLTPIPVLEAQRIAKKYKKAIVIICAWERGSGNKLWTTTYGESQEEKHWAASGGDIATKALGVPNKLDVHEDFRKTN